MAETTLKGQQRTEFGKGFARRLRAQGLVPAVIYGHGTDPVHIALPGHEIMLALRQANALLNIEVEGGKTVLALPKQVQRDPIKGFVEHVDLLIVKRGEKVSVDVNIVTTGEAAPDTLVTVDMNTITVKADATKLPNEIEVSIEGAEPGTQITLGDLQMPAGVEFEGEADQLVVNVTNAPTAAQIEAELEEAEAEAGIEHDEPESIEGEQPEGEGDEAASEESSDN